jgi:8-oxo-dGTP pyrophosphatase MutT (NUDIX family)
LTILQPIKRALFAVLSRTAVAVYCRLPIFGFLRASVAVVRNGPLVLIIDRSDGRGISFPGGLAFPWETTEEAMRREVVEETGLQIERAALMFEYKTSADVPCVLSVFEAEGKGNLAGSWEGSPGWRPFAEIRESLLPSQKAIVDRILGGAYEAEVGTELR